MSIEKYSRIIAEQGGDINRRDAMGRTLLFQAVLDRDLKALQFLIKKGAYINISDGKGIFPLCLAFENRNVNDLSIIDSLISNGAGITTTISNFPLLHYASNIGDLRLVRLLL